MTHLRSLSGDWRDCSGDNSTGCSSRGPGLRSQHPHDSWQPTVTPVPGDLASLCRHTCRQNTNAHKNSQNENKTCPALVSAYWSPRKQKDFLMKHSHVHLTCCSYWAFEDQWNSCETSHMFVLNFNPLTFKSHTRLQAAALGRAYPGINKIVHGDIYKRSLIKIALCIWMVYL